MSNTHQPTPIQRAFKLGAIAAAVVGVASYVSANLLAIGAVTAAPEHATTDSGWVCLDYVERSARDAGRAFGDALRLPDVVEHDPIAGTPDDDDGTWRLECVDGGELSVIDTNHARSLDHEHASPTTLDERDPGFYHPSGGGE